MKITYFVKTKYNDKKEPIMTSLYQIKYGETIFLIAIEGWRNTDDMLKLYKEIHK